MLPDLHVEPVLDTSTFDLIADFFVPLLGEARQYDRGVGYFSSGWFRIAAHGMVEFAAHGGRARWVTSPILTEDDWQALQTGDAARTDPLLYARLQANLDDVTHSLQSDTLSALAWMVADSVLDFKLALPRNKLEQGDFHDKFGIFTDADGNRLSFNGSYNDSIQGTRNYESIKTFCSWNPAFAPLVQSDRLQASDFEPCGNTLDYQLYQRVLVQVGELSLRSVIALSLTDDFGEYTVEFDQEQVAQYGLVMAVVNADRITPAGDS